MAVRIENDRLRAVINDLLDEYGDEARDAIQSAAKKVGKDVVKELKKGGGFKGSGAFNKGWATKTENTRLGSTTIVYNKDLPGLAHLLEFGHAKQNGGRTKAFNFIAPVAATVGDKFEEAFEKALG